MKLPRIRLPRWLKVLLALGAVFVVGVVLPVLIWLFADSALEDDSDLIVARRIVAPEDNGFELVNFTEEDIEKSEAFWSSFRDEDGMLDSETSFAYTNGFDGRWDPAHGREAIAVLAPAIERLERALERRNLVVAEIKEFDQRTPYLRTWLEIGKVLPFRARLALDDGRVADAFEDAFRLLEFGQRVARADGTIVTYLIGLANFRRGCEMFRQLVARADLDADALRRLQRRFERYEPTSADFVRAIRAGYALDRQGLESLAAREDVGFGPAAPELPLTGGHVVCPNETRNLYAERMRRLIEAAVLPPPERQSYPAALGTVEVLGVELRISIRNYSGRGLVDLIAETVWGSLEDYDSATIAHRATIAYAALRAYHLEHGSLPSSLELLVPRFLAAVPIDPFDGEPLRYSNATRRLWSIGEDGVDDGGYDPGEDAVWDDEAPGWKREPTFRIRFGE